MMAEHDGTVGPENRETMDNLTLNPFDVVEFETWLEDRAREGWRLREIGSPLTDFEKGEPQEVRYRLTPLPGKQTEPDGDFLDMAAAAGWEYVTTVQSVFHLWRCRDPEAPEMENDPVAQAEGYRYLARHMRWELVAVAAVLAIIVAPCVMLLNRKEWMLFLAQQAAPGWTVACIVYVIGGVWDVIRRRLRMSRTLRQLRAGIPMDRPRPWKRVRWIRRAALLAIPLYFYILLGDDLLKDGRDIADKADAMAKARYVDVAALNPNVSGEVEIWRARTKVTEWIPRCDWVEQVEWVPDPDYVEPDAELQPGFAKVSRDTAATGYYRLWTAGMAEEMEREQVADSRYRLEQAPSGRLDSFWWCEYDNGYSAGQYAVARLGTAVLWVDYDGPADLRRETDYLAELLR